MDLRIVKTKKAIREAFLEMRKTTPLEKIQVRDLCRKALINKSTFYNHYEDVFTLSDEIENELIDQCLEEFEYKDCLLTDPEKFLQNVPKVLAAREPFISVLFRERDDVLYRKLQRKLREYYSGPDMTARDDVRLTFLIGGMMYAMQELKAEGKYSDEVITEETVRIIERNS